MRPIPGSVEWNAIAVAVVYEKGAKLGTVLAGSVFKTRPPPAIWCTGLGSTGTGSPAYSADGVTVAVRLAESQLTDEARPSSAKFVEVTVAGSRSSLKRMRTVLPGGASVALEAGFVEVTNGRCVSPVVKVSTNGEA